MLLPLQQNMLLGTYTPVTPSPHVDHGTILNYPLINRDRALTVTNRTRTVTITRNLTMTVKKI